MTTEDQTQNLPAQFENQSDLIAFLSKHVPNNQLGLPEGIYRADLLPHVSALVHTPQNKSTELTIDFGHQSITERDDVKCAYEALDYSEGFPTYLGMPIWTPLPFEPQEAYKCFDIYLRQGSAGARQIYTLTEAGDFPKHANIGTNELQEYFHTYYWSARVRAYDMFYIAHRRREQERRALETDNSQYLMANRLMDLATLYLDEQQDELLEMLTPSGFMDLIKLATQLQRITSGLPANAPRGEQSGQASAPMEVIMRTIAQQALGDNLNTQAIDNRTEDNKHALKQVMQDPDILTKMQEIVISINGANMANSKVNKGDEMQVL